MYFDETNAGHRKETVKVVLCWYGVQAHQGCQDSSLLLMLGIALRPNAFLAV